MSSSMKDSAHGTYAIPNQYNESCIVIVGVFWSHITNNAKQHNSNSNSNQPNKNMFKLQKKKSGNEVV